MTDTTWKEVSPDFYRFETEGQELVGILSSKGNVVIRGTPVGKFTVDTEEGSVSFLGGVSLDPLLNKIDEGTLIKLVYQGKTPTQSGTHVKQFQLFVAEGD